METQELVKQVCEKEGGKVNLTSAQVSEVLAAAAEVSVEDPRGYYAAWGAFVANARRRMQGEEGAD